MHLFPLILVIFVICNTSIISSTLAHLRVDIKKTPSKTCKVSSDQCHRLKNMIDDIIKYSSTGQIFNLLVMPHLLDKWTRKTSRIW